MDGCPCPRLRFETVNKGECIFSVTHIGAIAYNSVKYGSAYPTARKMAENRRFGFPPEIGGDQDTTSHAKKANSTRSRWNAQRIAAIQLGRFGGFCAGRERAIVAEQNIQDAVNLPSSIHPCLMIWKVSLP